MAVSKWNFSRIASIDGKATTTNFSGAWNVGLLYVGGSKTALRRPLAMVDVSAAPDVGVSIPAGSTINSGYIELTVLTIFGTPTGAHTATRVSRDDWVAAEATWDIYKTANNWSTAGAAHDPNDINATTPASVGFNGPSGTGAFTISGLINHYTDARDNRSGRLHLRIRIDDEADDGVERFWTAGNEQFVVDYTAPPSGIGVALMGPAGGVTIL